MEEELVFRHISVASYMKINVQEDVVVAKLSVLRTERGQCN